MASRKTSTKNVQLVDEKLVEEIAQIDDGARDIAQSLNEQAVNTLTSDNLTKIQVKALQNLPQSVLDKKVSKATTPKEKKSTVSKTKVTKDDTIVSEIPGGNSEILNPTPKAEKAIKPAKEVKVEFALDDSLKGGLKNPATGEYNCTKITLGELLHLDKTPIVDAEVGLRQLNKDHVESLMIAYQLEKNIPPVKISSSTWGPVLVGGYHRESAMLNLIKLDFVDSINDKMTPEQKVQYLERVRTTWIVAQVVPGLTNDTIVEFAYSDNLESALPIAKENRSKFAVYLIHSYALKGVTLSLQEAGDKAGVSKQAVFYQLRRDKGIPRSLKATKMAADLVVIKEDKDELESYFNTHDAAQKVDRLRKAAKNIIASMLIVYDEVQDMEELVKYFSELAATIKTDAETFNAASESVLGALAMVELQEEEEQDNPQK